MKLFLILSFISIISFSQIATYNGCISVYNNTGTTNDSVIISGSLTVNNNLIVGNGDDTLILNNDTILNLVDISLTTVPAYRADSVIIGSYLEVGGVRIYALKQVLLDDGSIVLPASTSGFGTAQIGDSQEYTQFYWTTAGVVTLVANTANVVNTDTDTKFCIFDSGTTVTIRNRLAATLILRVNLTFSTN